MISTVLFIIIGIVVLGLLETVFVSLVVYAIRERDYATAITLAILALLPIAGILDMFGL